MEKFDQGQANHYDSKECSLTSETRIRTSDDKTTIT